jgi:hypothetical protein
MSEVPHHRPLDARVYPRCVEVSLPYDGAGAATALLAANVVWEVVARHALARARTRV